MKKIVLILFLLSSLLSTAQNGINYKAVIKDNGGNAIANQNITVEFNILKGIAQANVFQQTFMPTTDANGIISVTIGANNDFNTIDWGSDDHYLNVKVNTGAGLTDMGTTQFGAVPYALNVTGLSTIKETGTVGWRLLGRDPANYGNIGNSAVDLSISDAASTTNGATGQRSFATGYNTVASGLYATALGYYTTATGQQSFAAGDGNDATGNRATALGFVTRASGPVATAMGDHTEASGTSSTAMNSYTEANGDYTAAMGERTKADASHALAIGRYNVGGGNPTTWLNSDPLFEVGNGLNSANRTNALTILKDGTILAPTLALGLITDDKSLITKEYLEANSSAGLEAIDEGNGIGWRLKGENPNRYGNIGDDAVDLSTQFTYNDPLNGATGTKSFATGFKTQASGEYATSMGETTRASGNNSTALGRSAQATGENSTAIGFGSIASELSAIALGYFTEASSSYATSMGRQTIASGSSSTALGSATIATNIGATSMGSATLASGRSATSMGRFTTAQAFSGVALGRYNLGIGDSENWIDTDPVFEIGNGVDDANRSNAITVLKNGTITAPSFDLAEITDDKALITKEYADLNLGSSGLEAIDEGNGLGYRLKGSDPANYANIGENAVDFSVSNIASEVNGASARNSTAMGVYTQASGSYSTAIGWTTEATGNTSTAMGSSTTAEGSFSTAMGNTTTASGNTSTAMGWLTLASGIISTAMGNETTASGNRSTAMGQGTIASASYSTAMGILTTASGSRSTAIGAGTTAASAYSTAIGVYNIGGGDPSDWIETDPLFEIGNSINELNRNNALTVLKNGKIGIGKHTDIGGMLEIQTNSSFAQPQLALIEDNASYARLKFKNTNRNGDDYWDIAGLIGTTQAEDRLNFYNSDGGDILIIKGDGNVGIGTTPSYTLDVNGSNDGDYAAQIYNSSTNANADGLKIRVGRTTAPTSSNSFVAFFDGNNTSRGRIQGNGTGVTYATTSDRRLKTNIEDIENALTLIDKIQPRQYEYKTYLGKKEYGFIAQELQPLYTQAVIGTPNSDVEKEPMMVDYGRLTPLLTAGIKELNDKVISLEAENDYLKRELNTLRQLEAKLSEKETELSSINSRISKIEEMFLEK